MVPWTPNVKKCRLCGLWLCARWRFDGDLGKGPKLPPRSKKKDAYK